VQLFKLLRLSLQVLQALLLIEVKPIVWNIIVEEFQEWNLSAARAALMRNQARSRGSSVIIVVVVCISGGHIDESACEGSECVFVGLSFRILWFIIITQFSLSPFWNQAKCSVNNEYPCR
jgi:hypothetical protein